MKNCAGFINKWKKDKDVFFDIDISKDGFIIRKLVIWKIKRNTSSIRCTNLIKENK